MRKVGYLRYRKRAGTKLKQASSKWVTRLDRLVLTVAIIGPLFDIPQLTKIYLEKNAAGVSFLTWFFFALFGIPWFVYGVVHKDKPIIISYFLWVVIDVAVIIGVLLYG